jgi:phospho-N-acetylmuramoyl-pentapeptide-transferase
VLYYLYFLRDIFFPLNLFQYGVFRAAMAALTAFAIAVFFGRWFILFLRRRRALERTEKGDSARLVQIQYEKRETPTMGGVILLLAIGVSTLLWARLDVKFGDRSLGPSGGRFTWLLLIFVLLLGAVGFLDDYIKLTHPRKKGLAARWKFLAQVVLGAAAGLFLYLSPLMPGSEASSSIFLPFVKNFPLPAAGLGLLSFTCLVVLVTAGSSNAVNLTDGLDGLAIGCVVMVGVTFAVIGFLVGDARASDYLFIPHVPGAAETSVFAAALVGAGLGFLWFNCHPAQIFMGDTGALPLGGSLGLLSVITKQEVLLFVVGGVFVAEAASVILQVASYKLRGKRIFLIAPLHHHYQFKGWAETKVTVRFWIVAAILSLFSLVTLKIR